MRECESCSRNNIVDLEYCTNCGYDRSKERKWRATLLFSSGEYEGHTVYLTHSTLIGRSQELDIPLMQDKSVDRLHATIKGIGAYWTVYDNSHNTGVAINDCWISQKDSLCDGDVISIGESTATFHRL